MGTVDPQLATALRDRLGLRRAVETGTYRGLTARGLAPLFERVITVELSRSLHARAAVALSEFPNVEAIQGHSADVLSDIAAAHTPTLYFLDGHWSAGNTVGAENECPLLDELAAIGAGHPHDCLIIDDARLFTSAPPPPHDCAQWPTIEAIFDAARLQRPQHMVTVLSDQVIAVPASAKPAIDAYGARVQEANVGLRERSMGVLARARQRLVSVDGPRRRPPTR
ncbi:MAG TPA: hypothetical protein VK655_06735 [Solirubrobacteraceae bacterium]|nr:hypothetical protein [Solirubrobacteraceae bacterium]